MLQTNKLREFVPSCPHKFVVGLPSITRTYSDFISRAEQIILESSITALHSIFFIDADNLKVTNDTLGHRAGDNLIQEIEEVLSRTFGRNAVIFRKGGDEFFVFLSSFSHIEANLTSTSLTKDLNPVSGNKLDQWKMKCSIGLAHHTGRSASVLTLIEQANIALHAAKRSGKGHLRNFEDGECRAIEFERYVVQNISKVIHKQELSVHFQPIYNTGLRKICGAEALVRWFSEEHGSVPASLLINASRQAGKMKEMGEFVLTRACQEAARWPEDTFVAVNFVSTDFKRSDFSTVCLEIAAREGVSPRRLKMEITELEYLELNTCVRKNIEALQFAGVEIGVDDFGTGYSSMGTIDQFPADFLKVDMSIVRNCNNRKSSRIFLKAISSIAQHSSLTLIAEGIETMEELSVVRSAGFELGQGFYYSPAISSVDFLSVVSQNRLYEPILRGASW